PRRQWSRSGDHDGIIGCAVLATEERWTCPGSTGTGNSVDAFVVGVTAMTIHVLPAHARVMQIRKDHPQVTILHGGVGRCDPAAPSPGGEPFGKPVNDVSTIGKDGYLGARMQHLQGSNSRLQLHAIVCCGRCPATQFTHSAIGVENAHSPAARPRVPQACSIGIGYRTVHISALNMMPFTPSQGSRCTCGAATHTPVRVHRLGRKVWSNSRMGIVLSSDRPPHPTASPLLWEYSKTQTSKERPARPGRISVRFPALAGYNVADHNEILSGRGLWRSDVAKILLVEDNEMNHDMLSRRLTRRGFQVVIAVDGVQGVALALAESPDLILMDMSLPVMDGWEATQRLKTAPETQAIPIIALTAHAMAGDRSRALAAGCDDYDTKPIEFNRLFGKIQTLFGQGPTAE